MKLIKQLILSPLPELILGIFFYLILSWGLNQVIIIDPNWNYPRSLPILIWMFVIGFPVILYNIKIKTYKIQT